MKGRLLGIKSKSLAEQVADSIENMIISNEIKPGAKLPNEYELVEQLNVGRSSVREAIKILESKNVLTIVRGSGTFVCENLGMIEDPLGFRFVTDKKNLALDLCEVRSLIEPKLAERAAQNATAKDVEELQALCDEITYYIEKRSKKYSEKDIEFHSKIAQCSGNKVTYNLIPIINQGISTYTQLTDPALASRAPITHQAIVDAIRMRDSKKAKSAMQEHLQDNMDILLDVSD